MQNSTFSLGNETEGFKVNQDFLGGYNFPPISLPLKRGKSKWFSKRFSVDKFWEGDHRKEKPLDEKHNLSNPTYFFSLFIKGDPVCPESLPGLPPADEMGTTVQAMGETQIQNLYWGFHLLMRRVPPHRQWDCTSLDSQQLSAVSLIPAFSPSSLSSPSSEQKHLFTSKQQGLKGRGIRPYCQEWT